MSQKSSRPRRKFAAKQPDFKIVRWTRSKLISGSPKFGPKVNDDPTGLWSVMILWFGIQFWKKVVVELFFLFQTQNLSINIDFWYGGFGEMAQKVIEWDMFHVKSHAWEIEMAQSISHLNKKHVIEILIHFEIEPSRFCIHMTSRETCLIGSLFEPSQHTPHIIIRTYYCQGLNLDWTKFNIDKQMIKFIFSKCDILCKVRSILYCLFIPFIMVKSGSSTGFLISSFCFDEFWWNSCWPSI